MTPPSPRCRCAQSAIRGPARALIAAALFAVLAHPAATQPEVRRPEASRRIVASFDFEEPNNPFEVPASFFRAQSDPSQGIERPGYPIFNRASFDTARARSGERSVRLPIQRGSVSLRLRPGAIAVFPDADYTVACHVTAQGIEHARFRLVGRLLDQTGAPINNAEFSSEPVKPGAEWLPVEIAVPGGEHDNAAFLQIDAELVQPEIIGEAELGPHHVWPEDFTGHVWVDDIVVSQLPRVWIKTTMPSGIVVAPDQPELSLLVRDLTGERLEAHLAVIDSRGTPILTQTRTIRSGSRPQPWPIELNTYGWYKATLAINTGETTVGSAECTLLYVPPSPVKTDAEGGYGQRDLARFGISSDTISRTLLGALPHLGRSAATQSLALGIWTQDFEPEDTRPVTEALLELLTNTEHFWADPVISLPYVPFDMQQTLVIDEVHVLEALAAGHDVWDSYLDHVLDKLGHLAHRWRIGAVDQPPVFTSMLNEHLDTIRDEFAVLVPGPELGLTSSAHIALPDAAASSNLGSITISYEPGTGTDPVRDTVLRWSASPLAERSGLTLAFDASEHDRFASDAIASELVKRIIEAEAARSESRTGDTDIRLAYQIIEPWTIVERDRIVNPTPALAAWRSTIDRMVGRRLASRLTVAPGIAAYLLTPNDPEDPRGGALVAWNESATTDPAVRMNLGDGDVTMIDIWGNRTGPIPSITKRLDAGLDIQYHDIPLSQQPVFVEGIDVQLALFVASIQLDEPIIQATPGPHTRNLRISNPWPVAIDGDAIVLEPRERHTNGRRTGWDISPRVRRFSISPGDTTTVPLQISFSSVEETGPKPFIVDVAINSGPVQERLRASTNIDLRLDGIELDARTVVDDSGTNVALEAVVTNTTADPLDLTIHAAARGYPRQSAAIVQLASGASAVRRFVYPGGVQRLTNTEVYIGVEDPARRGRLNKRVSID